MEEIHALIRRTEQVPNLYARDLTTHKLIEHFIGDHCEGSAGVFQAKRARDCVQLKSRTCEGARVCEYVMRLVVLPEERVHVAQVVVEELWGRAAGRSDSTQVSRGQKVIYLKASPHHRSRQTPRRRGMLPGGSPSRVRPRRNRPENRRAGLKRVLTRGRS